jgi:YHS domain-containing protein
MMVQDSSHAGNGTWPIMTAMMRQTRKQILTMAALFAALLTLVGPAEGRPRGLVTDPLTGVALGGYDAVSYATGPVPVPGRPDFDYYWQGAPWYFSSAANRDIFTRNPEIYAPQFGGHATMSLSRGYFTDGNPLLYARHRVKLYLFYSAANREAFLMAPDAAIAAAEANWARLSGEPPPAPATEPQAAAPADAAPHVPDLAPAPSAPARPIAH